MLRNFTIVMLAAGLATACATTGKDRARSVSQPPPAWVSADGRLDARLDMAETMLRAGEPERAVAVLTAARQDQAEGFELDLLQARAFQAMGMSTEALALLEPHGDRHRKDAELHQLLGLLYFDLDRLDDAERSLTGAAERAPDDPEIANNLGFLLLVQERPAEAVPWLRRAVGLDPAQQRYRGNLGFALAADGQSEQALQIFRSAGPEPLALARLGVAHERASQPELAIARYHQALQLDPRQTVARSGLDRIAPSSNQE